MAFIFIVIFYFYFQGITKLAPNQNQKGHHFIKFKIIIPNKLSEAQRKAFEELSNVEEKINQNYGD